MSNPAIFGLLDILLNVVEGGNRLGDMLGLEQVVRRGGYIMRSWYRSKYYQVII